MVGLIMMKRTKHMEAGGCEMGRESIISGYLSLLVALLSDCWAGHAPDVYKTIITCIFVTSQECLSALIQDNEKIRTCHLAFKMSDQINPIPQLVICKEKFITISVITGGAT